MHFCSQEGRFESFATKEGGTVWWTNGCFWFPNWQYIPLIYIYIYIAFWWVICYLPSFTGTRNNHWLVDRFSACGKCILVSKSFEVDRHFFYHKNRHGGDRGRIQRPCRSAPTEAFQGPIFLKSEFYGGIFGASPKDKQKQQEKKIKTVQQRTVPFFVGLDVRICLRCCEVVHCILLSKKWKWLHM